MHQSVRWILLPFLASLAAACEQGSGAAVAAADEGTGITALPTADAPSIGSIGPVRYDFAPERMTRAEIELAVPPAYEATIWATKLILNRRAALLGERDCRYDQSAGDDPSTREEICTAEQEDGLALALLERPLADYRAAFTEAGIEGRDLPPVSLAGCEGFSFAAEEEGADTVYRFLPVGERTLLIAQQFSDEEFEPDGALADVMDSLRLPEQRC